MFDHKTPTQMTVVKTDGNMMITTDVNREFLVATLEDISEGRAITVPYVEANKLYLIPANKIDRIGFDFKDEDEDGD